MRMGIIGSGRIARRFVKESLFVKSVGVAAVYNPTLSSAERFLDERRGDFLDASVATDNLNNFFQSVDVAYIATPHTSHVEYAEKALEAGKHVLCEKPMALKRSEAEKLYALAEEKELVLMEALKTAYAPGFLKIVQLLREEQRIGKIYEVDAAFTKLMGPEDCPRPFQPELAGGSFTELGTYPLLAVVKLLGMDYQDIIFTSSVDAVGIDQYTLATVVYPDAIANIRVGLGVKTEGALTVAGNKGYLLAPSPWWLTKQFDLCFEDRSRNQHVETEFDGDGLRYEIEAFIQRIKDLKNTDRYREADDLFVSPEESIVLAEWMERYQNGRRDGSVRIKSYGR